MIENAKGKDKSIKWRYGKKQMEDSSIHNTELLTLTSDSATAARQTIRRYCRIFGGCIATRFQSGGGNINKMGKPRWFSKSGEPGLGEGCTLNQAEETQAPAVDAGKLSRRVRDRQCFVDTSSSAGVLQQEYGGRNADSHSWGISQAVGVYAAKAIETRL
jgi:hypothetical protein